MTDQVDHFGSKTLELLRAVNDESPKQCPLPTWPQDERNQWSAHVCDHHRLGGYVERQLSKIDPQQDWMNRTELRKKEKERRKKQLAGLRDLNAVLRAFTENGIQFGVFKGPQLSLRLFSDIAFRQTKDIDIFVRPADFPTAVQLLQDHGLALDDDVAGCTIRQFEVFQYFRKDIEVCVSGNCLIELHFRPIFQKSISDILEWDGGAPDSPIFPVATSTLSPVHEVFYLLCHGQASSWFRARWALDAWKSVMQLSNDDWQQIAVLAEKSRCTSAMTRSIGWLDFLWGGNICEHWITYSGSRYSLVNKDRPSSSIRRFLTALDDPPRQPKWRDHIFLTSNGQDVLQAILGSRFYPGNVIFDSNATWLDYVLRGASRKISRINSVMSDD